MDYVQGNVFVLEVFTAGMVEREGVFLRKEKPLEEADYCIRSMLTEVGEKVCDSNISLISRVTEKVPLNPLCNPNVEAV